MNTKHVVSNDKDAFLIHIFSIFQVMCFYRRNEIPGHLVSHADKHHWGESEPAADADIVDSDDEDAARDAAERAERALLKEREVFLSRQVHTPTLRFRGKRRRSI